MRSVRQGSGAAGLFLLLLALACDADQSARPLGVSTSTTTPGPATTSTTATAPATTTLPFPSTVPAGSVTLRATDVRLFNSEESDNAFRVLFESAASEVTVVLGGLPSPNRVVFVCPATELERRVPAAGCVTPADGERVKVPHRPDRRGVEVVQVGVAGTGAQGNSTTVGQIAITYPPSSREVRLRLPPLAPGDAGGAPSFTLSPAGPGAYRATATWSGGGNAEMTFTVGSNVSRAEGPPGAQTTGSVSPPVEGTVRIRNTSPSTLSGFTVTALFP